MVWRRVINASPLILLSRVGLLEILHETGVEAIVLAPVMNEIEARGLDDSTLRAVRGAPWLLRVEPPPIPREILERDFGPEESAVLALAAAEAGQEAILDDRPARRWAQDRGIPVRGTLGLILLAKAVGMIPAARPVLVQLRDSGMYLSDKVLNSALEFVDEWRASAGHGESAS